MKVRILWAAAFVAAAASLACGGGGPCGGTTCSATQRCTATQVCVTDEAPTVTIDAPTEGALVTALNVTVKGSASDDVSVAQVSIAVEGGSPMVASLMGGGAFSKDVMLPAKDSEAVTLTVTAIDSANRTAKATRKVVVDTIAPGCGMTGPALVTSVGDVVLSFTATDGSGTTTNARLSLDDAATFAPVTGMQFTWAVPSENGEVHKLVFRVDDAAGNTCEARLTVAVDNVKPVVAFSAPDAGTLLGPAFFAAGGVLSGTMGDGTRNVKSVTVAFADAGMVAATLGAGTWTAAVTAPAGADFAAVTATVTATDLADNTATASLGLTVDVVAPVLTVTAPAMNAKLNIASFPAGNDVAVTSTATDGDPQAPLVQLELDAGTSGPAVVTTAATDNPKAYAATLRATDRAGNVARASVAFSVDRVAPTVTATVPATGTRMFAGVASADFSEPMAATGTGLALTPDAGGAWTTAQKWTSAALTKDTAFAATAGTGTDTYGNPIAAMSLAFHTEPFLLAAGVALTSGLGLTSVVEAKADQEGVLSVLAFDGLGKPHFLRFDGATGVAQDSAFPAGTTATKLVVWRTVQPNLASLRIAGATYTAGGIDQVVAIAGATVVNGPMGSTAFIPTPAFSTEGTNLGDYGYITNGAYTRAGRAPIPVDLAVIHSIQVTSTRWEIANYTGGSHTQSFGCFTYPGGFSNCQMRAVVDVTNVAAYSPSSAASRFCTANVRRLVPNQTTTTMVPWQPTCGPPIGPVCESDKTAGAANDVVADLVNDGTFYGLTTPAAGTYQMRKLVLDATCAGAWVDQGAAVSLPSTPRPVVVRGVPMLVYADAAGDLKLAAP